MKIIKQTCSVELFVSTYNIDGGLITDCILRAACKESSRYILIYFFLISSKIPSMGSWVYRRMCFIVIFAFARCLKGRRALLKSTYPAIVKSRTQLYILNLSLLSKISPGCIDGLFLDERLKVEFRIELIRFRTRIREESLLIEFFSNLYPH